MAYRWGLKAMALDLLASQRTRPCNSWWGKNVVETFKRTYPQLHEAMAEPMYQIAATTVQSASTDEDVNAFMLLWTGNPRWGESPDNQSLATEERERRAQGTICAAAERAWTDPGYAMCRRRLRREFDAMAS